MERLQKHLKAFSNEIINKTNKTCVSCSSKEIGTFKIESHEISDNFDFSIFFKKKKKALDDLMLIEERKNSFHFHSSLQ